MLGKYWYEPANRLYIKNCPAFEPSVFEPGVYFYIKYIGNPPVLANEFQQSMVFETGEFKRPKFDCMSIC